MLCIDKRLLTNTEERSRNAAFGLGESVHTGRMMKRKLPTVLIEMHHNHLTCKKSPGGFAGRAFELQPFETFEKVIFFFFFVLWIFWNRIKVSYMLGLLNVLITPKSCGYIQFVAYSCQFYEFLFFFCDSSIAGRQF